MIVRECMSPPAQVVHPEDRLDQVLALYSDPAVPDLAVVDIEGRFLGLVSIRDVHAAAAEMAASAAERGVLSVMQMGVRSIRGDALVEDAWDMLANAPGTSRVAVVTDGKFEGTITQHDLLRAMADLPKLLAGDSASARTRVSS